MQHVIILLPLIRTVRYSPSHLCAIDCEGTGSVFVARANHIHLVVQCVSRDHMTLTILRVKGRRGVALGIL